MEFQKILFVGIGGFIGAEFRYLLSLASVSLLGERFPFGTLVANISGGLLIGFIMELSIVTDMISPAARLFIVTGILGGLTTFSAFSWETISLFGDGSYQKAVINIVLNLVISLCGVFIGRFIAHNIL